MSLNLELSFEEWRNDSEVYVNLPIAEIKVATRCIRNEINFNSFRASYNPS